jgi:hypothetical protein
MQTLSRTLVIGSVIAGSLLLSWLAHGQNSVRANECSIIPYLIDDSGSINGGLIEEWRKNSNEYLFGIEQEVYPDEAITLALEHLQAYCCDEKFLKNGDDATYCPKNISKQYPESGFLFDHLLDIGMRRVDGDPDTIYDRVDLLNPQAAAWRKRIKENGSEWSGNPPALIYSEFQKKRQADKNKESSPLPVVDQVDFRRERCEAIQDYESVNLLFESQCDIAFCMTEYLRETSERRGYLGTFDNDNYVTYYTCRDRVQQRVDAEYNYLERVIRSQANALQEEVLSTYVAEYTIGQRLPLLSEKILKRLAWLEIINTKYEEGTKMCHV